MVGQSCECERESVPTAPPRGAAAPLRRGAVRKGRRRPRVEGCSERGGFGVGGLFGGGAEAGLGRGGDEVDAWEGWEFGCDCGAEAFEVFACFGGDGEAVYLGDFALFE